MAMVIETSVPKYNIVVQVRDGQLKLRPTRAALLVAKRPLNLMSKVLIVTY